MTNASLRNAYYVAELDEIGLQQYCMPIGRILVRPLDDSWAAFEQQQLSLHVAVAVAAAVEI